MRTDIINLMVAILTYAVRCAEDGDLEGLLEMGFGPTEIALLAELKLIHVRGIVRHTDCFSVRLNQPAFRSMVRSVRLDGDAAEWEHVLIRCDAPFDMVRQLFGTSRRTYKNWRRLFKISWVSCSKPDPGMVIAIRNHLADRAHDRLAPHEYLQMSEETGAPLRTIWREVCNWQEP